MGWLFTLYVILCVSHLCEGIQTCRAIQSKLKTDKTQIYSLLALYPIMLFSLYQSRPFPASLPLRWRMQKLRFLSPELNSQK